MNMDSVEIPGTVFLDIDWQFAYMGLSAPVALDFGEGKDTVDALLRNRQADFSLQADSVRFVSAVPGTSTALVSLRDYPANQGFVVEAEMTLQDLAGVGINAVGLVVLGGPHDPEESPFESSDADDFYTLSFNLGETTNDSGTLQIRERYRGNVLAEEAWTGQPIFTDGVVFSDDFEDAAVSEGEGGWTSGGVNNLWELGEPISGPGEAPSGSNVFATSLDEPFQTTTEAYLRSPVIDLTGATGAVLTYMDFNELDDQIDGAGDPYHTARVSVLNAANLDEVLEVLSATRGVMDGWRSQQLALSSASLGREVIVEFLLIPDNFSPVNGWYLDDVVVTRDLSPLPLNYTLRAEGVYFSTGAMELSFTLSEGDGPGQTIMASIIDPFGGNLFGFGARRGIPTGGAPMFDFNNLIIELVEDSAISNIPTQTIVMNSRTGPIPFRIQDDEVDPSLLTVTGSSSNPDLVPDENILIEGEGVERTVTVTPVIDELGSTVITLTLSGGASPVSTNFSVHVVPPEFPMISAIPDQVIMANTTTGPISFTISDQHIDAASLILTGTSSDTNLVPHGNIVFGGSGSERTVTVTPTPDLGGTATITVTVDNGYLTADSSFMLTVAFSAPLAYEFGSGTLEGWTGISEDSEGRQFFAIVEPSLNSPTFTPHSGTHLLGLHIPAFDLDAGYTQDSEHDTLVMSSPEFRLTDVGDLSVWLVGGGAGSGSLAGTSVGSLQTASSAEGFLGVALRNVTTGTYVLSGTKGANGGSWQKVVFTAAELAGLPQDDVYTLDLIDARQGGWGWISMDSVTIPGILVNPPAIDQPTLTIERWNGDFVRLSWSAAAWSFTLQRALEVGGEYIDVDLGVTIEDDEIVVYDEIIAPKQFYRMIE